VVPSRGSRSDDHVITRRSNANPLDGNANELLDELNVLPSLAGQVVVALRAGGRLLPPRHGLVVNLYLGQHIGVRGETIELLALVRVCSCNLELLEVVEDVELGEVEGGVVVASVRVLHDDKIEPSATAFATCCNTDLVSDLLELLADLVELFGGEGTATNTGGVSLDHADDVLDGSPAEGETCDDTTKTSVRGGDEGICAVVDIEHERIGTLHKDLGVFLLCRLEERNLVDDVGSDLWAEFLVIRQSRF
jgi:hypothetical protein